MVSLLLGKEDLTGEKRIRERDRECALANASTSNCIERGEPQDAAHDCYKRIVSRPEALDEM